MPNCPRFSTASPRSGFSRRSPKAIPPRGRCKPLKSYSLVVFDFDGTLVDTAPDIALYANSVLGDFGFPSRPLEDVKRAVGKGVHELLKSLAPGLAADPARLEEAVVSFRRKYSETPVVSTEPYPHVVEMLEGPLRGVKKAIATNKPHEITRQILSLLSLERHFDVVLGMGGPFPAKPDPASLRHILEALGVAAAEAVLVGDSGVDAETARRAGIDFVWMDYGYDDAPASLEGVRRLSSARDWAGLAP